MASAPSPTLPGAEVSLHGNVLNAAIRRDIADLNRQFLGLCLLPELAEDERFCLPGNSARRLQACPSGALDRIASCPFSLFSVRLPLEASLALAPAGHVADARRPSVDPAIGDRCQTFLLIALAVARRVAEGGPLAARIALGLTAEADTRLATMTPSELAAVASWPGLVTPRWPHHDRYWAMLAAAGAQDGPDLLHLAFCVGLCLLDTSDRAGAAGPQGIRRRPR